MDDQQLNAIFCEWAEWVRSKRLYSPNPNPPSIIGRLRLQAGLAAPRDFDLSADMARLHLAIMGGGDRAHLVVAHFLHRPYYQRRVGTDPQGSPIYRRRMVKEMAAAAGIARESWNRSVRRACRDIYSRAQGIECAPVTEAAAEYD
jgi:hypothetical protein